MLMKMKPMEATSLASERRSISAASGQRMSCGTAIQMSVSPTSSARNPRTEPKNSGIRYAVARIVRRRNAMSRNWLGIGAPNTTLRLKSGRAVSASMDEKRHEQQAAGQQQAPHHSRVQPVEPIALIEGGIDQGEPAPTRDEAEYIGWRPRRDRLAGNAAMQAQRHDQRERHVLPEDPPPGMVLDVPALERSRYVERQLEIERIDRDAECPILRRHVEQDETQGERNEESRCQSAEKLQRQQRGQIRANTGSEGK